MAPAPRRSTSAAETTDPPPHVRAQPTLRAQNRLRVKSAITAAALELSAEHGFGAISVEDIAGRAGISPRTFFRHFDAKHDVLLPVDPLRVDTDAIVDVGDDVDELEAVHRAFAASCDRIESRRAEIMMLRDALDSSPALRGRDFDHRVHAEHAIADALVRRSPTLDPADALTAATVGFGLVRRSIEIWLGEPAGTPIAPLLDRQFELVRRLAASTSPIRPRRQERR